MTRKICIAILMTLCFGVALMDANCTLQSSINSMLLDEDETFLNTLQTCKYTNPFDLEYINFYEPNAVNFIRRHVIKFNETRSSKWLEPVIKYSGKIINACTFFPLAVLKELLPILNFPKCTEFVQSYFHRLLERININDICTYYCNWKQKGIEKWLKWLSENNPEKYEAFIIVLFFIENQINSINTNDHFVVVVNSHELLIIKELLDLSPNLSPLLKENVTVLYSKIKISSDNCALW